MKKILLYTSLILSIISCTKEVDSPELLSQIDSLKNQVATLQTQVAAGSDLQNQLNAKTAELNTAEANYTASQSSLSESLEAYSTLETAYLDLSNAYDEIIETFNLWFYNTEGVYQFYVTNNGVRVADYVWDLGTTPDSNGDEGRYGVPYFDEYIYSENCYALSAATSLGKDTEVYISQASFDDLEIIAYNAPAANYSIFDINTTYTSINQTVKITRRTGGIYVLIAWYDTDFNLIGTLGNTNNTLPLPALATSEIDTIVLCN